MSTLFLSESLRLARKVAVKVLAQDLADEDTFRERFVRESLIAASLDHPNVIPIYDAGEFEGLLAERDERVQSVRGTGSRCRPGPLSEPIRR